MDSPPESSIIQKARHVGSVTSLELKQTGLDAFRTRMDDAPPSLIEGVEPVKPEVRTMGWECAYVLLQEYSERLTVQEHIMCLVARFSAPERARNPGAVLALYLRIAGVRT